MNKFIFGTLILLFSLNSQGVFAQQKNQFLDRSYWKEKPSIGEIESSMSDVNLMYELDKNQFDPVVFAIIEKNPLETILFLLSDKNNDVNKITHDKRTYLFWAAYAGNLDLMKHLIKKGAKTDLLDEHGNSVMIFAASNGLLDPAIYDFLLENGADIKKEKTTSGANALLVSSPYMNDTQMIDYFVQKGLSLEDKDDLGNGLFIYAARNGNQDFLSKLIDLNVDFLSTNSEGGNAFYSACQGSRFKTNTVEFYKFLENLGINPAFQTSSGTNALHLLAGRSKDAEVIKYFISKSVDVNQKDKDGNTPFLIAAGRQTNFQLFNLIASGVVDFKVVNNDSQSALMLALESNNIEVIEFLFSKGVDKKQFDNNGNGLAFYLLNGYDQKEEDSFDKKLDLITKNGFDIFKTQANGNTIFHNIAYLNDLVLLKKFANSRHNNINALNKEGLAPIHIAAMKAIDVSLLTILIELGADKKIKTEFGETVHDLASENELLSKEKSSIDFLK